MGKLFVSISQLIAFRRKQNKKGEYLWDCTISLAESTPRSTSTSMAMGRVLGRRSMYTATSSNDQVWSITNPNSTSQQEVASNSGLTYKLNANRNYDPWSYDHWICDLYTTNADTYLVFEKTSVSNVYRIRLNGASTKNYYLTAAGTSGSQVYFKPNLGTSDKTQQWTLKSVSTAFSYPYTRFSVSLITLSQ